MKFSDIKRHLQPYSIVARRKTTINHAFAAAIAPCDTYDEDKVTEAIKDLGQNPAGDLKCVYCDKEAETWDHVYATVKNSEFSGHGHRLGNLLPCCKPCNSQKGNKKWEEHIRTVPISENNRLEKEKIIQNYLDKHSRGDESIKNDADYRELMQIRGQIIDLMKAADNIAAKIRKRSM
jgi:hypothetical protein